MAKKTYFLQVYVDNVDDKNAFHDVYSGTTELDDDLAYVVNTVDDVAAISSEAARALKDWVSSQKEAVNVCSIDVYTTLENLRGIFVTVHYNILFPYGTGGSSASIPAPGASIPVGGSASIPAPSASVPVGGSASIPSPSASIPTGNSGGSQPANPSNGGSSSLSDHDKQIINKEVVALHGRGLSKDTAVRAVMPYLMDKVDSFDFDLVKQRFLDVWDYNYSATSPTPPSGNPPAPPSGNPPAPPSGNPPTPPSGNPPTPPSGNPPTPPGGGSPTPPGGGSPNLTSRDKILIRDYADKEHAAGITDVESAWRNVASSILGDVRIQCTDQGVIKGEFVGYWRWAQYDRPAKPAPSGGSQPASSGGGSGRNKIERELDLLYNAGATSFDDLFDGLLGLGYNRSNATRKLVDNYLKGKQGASSGNGTGSSSGNGSGSGTPSSSGGASANSGQTLTLPNVATDQWGYGGELHESTMNAVPILGEPATSSTQYEPSRKRSQAFAEWALSYRRYASNQYLNDLAKRLGIKVNSYHFDDVRRAMGIFDEITPELQRYADARYRALDYLNTPQSERMLQRAGLDARGKTRSVGEFEASWFERIVPFSEYNIDRRNINREYQSALAQESDAKKDYLDAKSRGDSQDVLDQLNDQYRAASARRRELEYDRQRVNEGYAHWDSPHKKDARSLESAKDIIAEIDQTFDPITGERRTNNAPSPELAALLNARNSEEVSSAFGRDRAERELYAAEEAAQEQRERERARRAAFRADWARRGEMVGRTAGSGVGYVFGGAEGAKAGARVGGAVGKTLGSSVASVILGFQALKKVTDKLVETWQKFRRWVEETVNMVFALAPYNGRLGAAQAWFQGEEYRRNVWRAENLEESSVKVIQAWNELLNNTQDLRDGFIELSNALKLATLRVLNWGAKAANWFSGLAKRITGEEHGGWASGILAEGVLGAGALIAGLITLNPALIVGGGLALGGSVASIVNNKMKDSEAADEGREKLSNVRNKPMTEAEIRAASRDIAEVRVKSDGTVERKGLTDQNVATEAESLVYRKHIETEGDVAREFFETGDLSNEAVAKYRRAFGDDWTKEKIVAQLKDSAARDYFEDAIAYNDQKRGKDYYQGYRGLDGKPASDYDIAQVLEKIDNTNLALLKSNEYLLSIKDGVDETAENTRDKNMLTAGGLYLALDKLAKMYQSGGNENGKKSADVNNGTAGVNPFYGMSGRSKRNETLYGELAGAGSGRSGGKTSGREAAGNW